MASGYPDYEGGKSGLYLKTDWAAKEGQDQFIQASGADIAPGGDVSQPYLVPTGKKFVICDATYSSFAHELADADKNQMVLLVIANVTVPMAIYQGGNGGGGIIASPPAIIPAGHIIVVSAYNVSGHNCDITATIGGYLV